MAERSDDQYKAAEHDRRIANLIRTGTIAEVDLAAARARVKLDADWITDFLPWAELAGGVLRAWSAPSIGEQVLVLSPSGETGAGLIVRGLYSGANPAPSADPQLTLTLWSDGGQDSYHAGDHLRLISVPAGGRVTVKVGASEIQVEDGQATVTAGAVMLGAGSRQPVARVGDQVKVGASTGVIVSGSGVVSAA